MFYNTQLCGYANIKDLCQRCKPVSHESEESEESEVTLRTVNYNIFGRWFRLAGYEGQDERLAAIPEAIAAHPKMGTDVDVITIEEAWCPDSQIVTGSLVCEGNTSANSLISGMAKYGWKYHTNIIDRPGTGPTKKQTGGGSIIFSKWPIEATFAYVYKSGAGQDKSAAKGAIYIRITKTIASGKKQVLQYNWYPPPGLVHSRGSQGKARPVVRNCRQFYTGNWP